MLSQSNKSGFRNPWVWGLLAIIIVVLAVDGTFIWVTMKPGRSELVDRDYKTKDRKSNDEVLNELGRQKSLGWKTDIKRPLSYVVGVPAAYEISLTDKDGKKVTGGVLEVGAYRAADSSKDFTTVFKEVSPGVYQGSISYPLKGYWELHIHVQRGNDEFGVSTTRFMVDAAS